MRYYIGVLDHTEGLWGVMLPDFPGCVGAGPSPEQAISDATAALRESAGHLRSAGHPLPEPTPLEAILSEGEFGNAPVTALIPLYLDAGRSVRANLTMDAGLLEAIDDAAAASGVTRSAFIASAARAKLLQAG